MDRTFWLKQTLDKPLFDDIIWNKPQRKSLAGNLLIVGGNAHAIIAPGEAYKMALNQGIGDCRVVMPDATRKLLGPKLPPNIELLSSNPSGSFSAKAIDELKTNANWANGVLFIGNLGHSAETAIMMDETLKLPTINTYCGDGADYFAKAPLPILRRKNTLLAIDISQLQKYGINAKLSQPFKHDMELLQIVDRLHEFTNLFDCHILTINQSQIIVASGGQVVSTKVNTMPQNWPTMLATAATVWWLQNTAKPLRAITTAITQLELS
jgi:hypothetical protein